MKPDGFHIDWGRESLADVDASSHASAFHCYCNMTLFAIFHDINELRDHILHIEEGHVQNGLGVIKGEQDLRSTTPRVATSNKNVRTFSRCHQQETAAAGQDPIVASPTVPVHLNSKPLGLSSFKKLQVAGLKIAGPRHWSDPRVKSVIVTPPTRSPRL